jgi:hypothetical protein
MQHYENQTLTYVIFIMMVFIWITYEMIKDKNKPHK